MASPFIENNGLLYLRVRLSPGASKNEIVGNIKGADGELWLKAAVTAIPEKGKANKALIKLLSKHFRIPKSAFAIKSGGTSHLKIFKIMMPIDTLKQLIGLK